MAVVDEELILGFPTLGHRAQRDAVVSPREHPTAQLPDFAERFSERDQSRAEAIGD